MPLCCAKTRKSLFILLVFILALACTVIQPAKAEKSNIPLLSPLPYWSADSPALASIQAFVNTVTDPDSEGYIAPSDRIAVFDFDGTLYGEDGYAFTKL